MGLLGINPILAAESQARHLLVALEAGEPYRVARALHVESVVSALRRGRPDAATDRLLAAARAIGARLQHPHLEGLGLLAAGVSCMVAARWREAKDRLGESEGIPARPLPRGLVGARPRPPPPPRCLPVDAGARLGELRRSSSPRSSTRPASAATATSRPP